MGLVTESYMAEALSKKNRQLHKTKYNWRIILPDLGEGGLGGDYIASRDGAELDPDSLLVGLTSMDEVSHRVYSASIPMPSFENQSIYDPRFDYGVAGHKTYGDLVLTVDEMEDGRTLRYFTEWMRMIKNTDGTYNVPSFYRRNILQMHTAASNVDLGATEMTGVYPTSITPVELSYDDPSVMQYVVTLNVDQVKDAMMTPAAIEAAIAARQLSLGIRVGGVSLDGLGGLSDGFTSVFQSLGI